MQLSSQALTYSFEQLEKPPAGPIDEREVRAQAQRQGHEEGYAEGITQGRAQIAQAVAALSTAAAGLEAMRDELATSIELDAIELALNVAERIVAGTLDVQPERVRDVVRGAVRRIADRHSITVIVSPEDLEIFGSNVDEMRAELGGIDQCDIQSDRRVGRGGAIIRTTEGEIDVRIETQLQRARELATIELAALEEGA